MAYSVPMILCNTSTVTVEKVNSPAGFPTTFNYFLFSAWGCFGPNAATVRSFAWYNIEPWGRMSFASYSVSAYLKSVDFGPLLFNGSFACTAGATLTHFLVSIDTVNQIFQIYANDAALGAPASGGWINSGSFNLTAWNQWSLDNAGGAAPGSGCGDLFAAAPASFYDLSVTANRRKFINADLTPVDLGPDASSVLGSAPPVYLTARSGVATDFANNNGSGGSFTYTIAPTFQAPGSCVLAPPPPGGGGGGPPPPASAIRPYLRETTYRQRFLGRSFDPTFVLTKTRPGPLRIVEIDCWMDN